MNQHNRVALESAAFAITISVFISFISVSAAADRVQKKLYLLPRPVTLWKIVFIRKLNPFMFIGIKGDDL